jgi:hypothetical protein
MPSIQPVGKHTQRTVGVVTKAIGRYKSHAATAVLLAEGEYLAVEPFGGICVRVRISQSDRRRRRMMALAFGYIMPKVSHARSADA